MFCRVCGNELNEQAIVCPKCGCLVSSNAKITNVIEHKSGEETPKIQNVSAEDVEKALNKKITIFSIIAFCVGMFSMFMASVGGGPFGFLTALGGLAMGVLTLIFAVKNKKNAPLLIIGVVAFAFTIFSLFMCFILNDICISLDLYY